VTPYQLDGVSAGVPQHLRVVVGVDVDEAGRDDQAGAAEPLLGLGPVEPADRRDAPVPHTDIGGAACRAGPVHDRAAGEHDVERHGQASGARATSRPR